MNNRILPAVALAACLLLAVPATGQVEGTENPELFKTLDFPPSICIDPAPENRAGATGSSARTTSVRLDPRGLLPDVERRNSEWALSAAYTPGIN